jgi:4-hydroxybenzoate polyprenyltransferase
LPPKPERREGKLGESLELDGAEEIGARAAEGVRSPTVAQGLILACRPRQWPKNFLVYFGLVFALKLFEVRLFADATVAFLVFCALSSAVYLVNDLADVESDRQHPVKCKRPLAAGIIRPGHAGALAVVLVVPSLLVAYLLSPAFGAVSLGYLVLQLAYSYRLKHLVLIDVFAIAAGFVFRAVAGAVVVGVPISPWLYVCTVLAALFVGLAKRRNELVLLNSGAANHRRILDEYSPQFLDQLITVIVSATVMAYSLYTFSAEGLPRNHAMMLTIPFVLYGLFRYLYLVHMRNGGGSPEEVLLKDTPFLANALLWMGSAIAVLYLFRS